MRLALMLLSVVVVGFLNQSRAALSKGSVAFKADFEEPGALAGWAGSGRLAAGFNSGHSLAIERGTERPARASAMTVQFPVAVEQVRGCVLRGTAMVKAENVSDKPNPWNGIKFMLAIETPLGRLWPQAGIDGGSFDWRRVAFSARIPTNASRAVLYLGLEEVTGKAYFDDVSVVVAKEPVAVHPRVLADRPFKGHDLPRLRGAMVSPNIDADSLRVLSRDWNANLIRWQLVRNGRPGEASSLEEYDRWLEGELKKLDVALPLCQKNGLYVVVDLHSPPGGKTTVSGYVGADDRLFSDRLCQDKFVQVWSLMARRYQEAQPIWGYDLVNEPVEGVIEEGCDDWQSLAERAAKTIRAIDPQRTIIVEPPSGGGPAGFSEFVPLSVSNVVYSVHMYLPHAFTHQGVNKAGPEYSYPGSIQGKFWDKAQLEAALQPAIEFQKNYGVSIYVGEFSAIRWAPDSSAFRYLRDLIDVFEEHGWDWSYHAFREWNGWSVEHGPDRQNHARVSSATDRQQLLCRWFAQNHKPKWTQ